MITKHIAFNILTGLLLFLCVEGFSLSAKEQGTFDMDSFLVVVQEHETGEIYDEIEYFYNHHFRHLPGREALAELEKMRTTAHALKNRRLGREVEYAECFILVGYNDDMILVRDRLERTKDKKERAELEDILRGERDKNFVWYRIRSMEKLARKAHRRGDRGDGATRPVCRFQ